MRTTVRLDDDLLKRAKLKAAAEGRSPRRRAGPHITRLVTATGGGARSVW
jgi:hypothetical protein